MIFFTPTGREKTDKYQCSHQTTAFVGGRLEDQFPFEGTLGQVPCSWGGGQIEIQASHPAPLVSFSTLQGWPASAEVQVGFDRSWSLPIARDKGTQKDPLLGPPVTHVDCGCVHLDESGGAPKPKKLAL